MKNTTMFSTLQASYYMYYNLFVTSAFSDPIIPYFRARNKKKE